MRPSAFPSLVFGLFLAALFTSPAAAQTSATDPADFDFQAGREYVELTGPPTLEGPDDGRIEVLSFFWYNCGACYHVDSRISAWAGQLPADVRFTRLPFSYRDPTIFHARIFFALASLGLDHKADQAVFDLFQKKRQPVNRPEQLPELAKALKIDQEELTRAFNSAEVSEKMADLDRLMLVYDLPGVPSMVINGKYRFDLGTAHGPDGFLKLADMLIEKERQARK